MSLTVTPLCPTANFFREHIEELHSKVARYPRCAAQYLQTRLELQRIHRKHVDICGECQVAEEIDIGDEVA